jgi:DNA-binding PadR family transcriptional regulator
VYAKEAIVLRVLLQKKNKAYGLEIVRLSGYQIVQDTVYRTLHRMTRKKWVASKLILTSKTRSRRRVYTLTPLGRDLARRLLLRQGQPIRRARRRK